MGCSFLAVSRLRFGNTIETVFSKFKAWLDLHEKAARLVKLQPQPESTSCLGSPETAFANNYNSWFKTGIEHRSELQSFTNQKFNFHLIFRRASSFTTVCKFRTAYIVVSRALASRQNYQLYYILMCAGPSSSTTINLDYLRGIFLPVFSLVWTTGPTLQLLYVPHLYVLQQSLIPSLSTVPCLPLRSNSFSCVCLPAFFRVIFATAKLKDIKNFKADECSAFIIFWGKSMTFVTKWQITCD